MPGDFILGWEEWLSLPELGLPAIKAKVDTGARTSALHAFLIEPFGPPSAPMVRFGVHPITGRDDIEIYCSAPVVDRREVTSSNGEKETRFVIRSRVRIGERSWPIELTLTNRENMSYRMLLGRQAIQEDIHIDPASSFRQPRLSYKLYRHLPKLDPVRRALRIAVLTRKPEAPSSRMLADAAEARGHTLELVDVAGLSLSFDEGMPTVLSAQAPLPHFDAVIPRITDRAGAAVIRQLELNGSFALNPGDALDRVSNSLAMVQALVRAGVPTAEKELSLVREGENPVRAGGPRIVGLVVGGHTIALMKRRLKRLRDIPERRMIAERRLAEKAARALQLGLATIELTPATEDQPPAVAAVSSVPSLSQVVRATGVQAPEAVIATIEREVRSWVRRATGTAGQSDSEQGGTEQS